MSKFDQIEKGTLSFRAFRIAKQAGTKITAAQFAQNIIPDIAQIVGKNSVTGWAAMTPIMGRTITDDNCLVADRVCVSLIKAQKKPPADMLAVELSKEIEAEKIARGVGFLPLKTKQEIKERVIDNLTKDVQPSINCIPCVINNQTNAVIACAVSDSQMDQFMIEFNTATGCNAIPETPDSMLVLNGWHKSRCVMLSMSPDQSLKSPSKPTIGMDFLTWLMYRYDKAGVGNYMLKGPVALYGEYAEARTTVLKQGTPTLSKELKNAIKEGKKIKKIKLVIVKGDNVFSAVIDDDFAFRSVKLPKPDSMYSESILIGRIHAIDMFMELFNELFAQFAQIHINSGWTAEVEKIREWVGDGQ